jgi:hypothetical protein
LLTLPIVVVFQSKSLVDHANEVILMRYAGTFKPGDRLTQEDVAARLDVSRQLITHALAIPKLHKPSFLMDVGAVKFNGPQTECELFGGLPLADASDATRRS